MQCSLEEPSIRPFFRAFGFATKVVHGTQDVFIEAARDALYIRILNMSTSVFAEFMFPVSFFSDYHFTVDRSISARLFLKVLVLLGRSASTFQKVRLSLVPSEAEFVIEIDTRKGIKRLCSVNYEERASQRAVYRKEDAIAVCTVQSSVLAGLLYNLPDAADVSLALTKEGLALKGYAAQDIEKDTQGRAIFEATMLATKLQFLELRDAAVQAEQCFPLKELKRLLDYGEIGYVTIYTATPGLPVIFAYEEGDSRADFVIATTPAEGPAGRGAQESAPASASAAAMDTTASPPQMEPSSSASQDPSAAIADVRARMAQGFADAAKDVLAPQ